MARALTLAAVVVVAAMAGASAAQAGDAAKGQHLFSRCAVCHSADSGGGNRVGPNLFGVVGRKAGSVPGFAYSPAMKAAAITWDEATLAKYLASPASVVPGTRMPFAGFSESQDASDVAAYLATRK